MATSKSDCLAKKLGVALTVWALLWFWMHLSYLNRICMFLNRCEPTYLPSFGYCTLRVTSAILWIGIFLYEKVSARKTAVTVVAAFMLLVLGLDLAVPTGIESCMSYCCLSPNPFDTLEIDKSADFRQLKRAYRQKALRYHPEKYGDEAMFNLIVRAYETLVEEWERHGTLDFFGRAEAPTGISSTLGLLKQHRRHDIIIWMQLLLLFFVGIKWVARICSKRPKGNPRHEQATASQLRQPCFGVLPRERFCIKIKEKSAAIIRRSSEIVQLIEKHVLAYLFPGIVTFLWLCTHVMRFGTRATNKSESLRIMNIVSWVFLLGGASKQVRQGNKVTVEQLFVKFTAALVLGVMLTHAAISLLPSVGGSQYTTDESSILVLDPLSVLDVHCDANHDQLTQAYNDKYYTANDVNMLKHALITEAYQLLCRMLKKHGSLCKVPSVNLLVKFSSSIDNTLEKSRWPSVIVWMQLFVLGYVISFLIETQHIISKGTAKTIADNTESTKEEAPLVDHTDVAGKKHQLVNSNEPEESANHQNENYEMTKFVDPDGSHDLIRPSVEKENPEGGKKQLEDTWVEVESLSK